MVRVLILTCLLCISAPGARAGEFERRIRDYFDTHVAGWVEHPRIIRSVRAQNAANADLTQADINQLDERWRAEVGGSATPTINPVLNSDAADFLRARVAASDGAIGEIFVMDRHGLNVAASSVTSDFWQGDEDKFIQTFLTGTSQVHVGRVEFDDSTQNYSAQVSVTLIDDVTGAPIGALTVGLNAEALF